MNAKADFWTRDDAAAAAFVPPIAVKPIVKPRYVNLHVNSFAAWYRDNEPAVTQFWNELGGGQDEYEDFREFAWVQFEIEQELCAAARETTYGREVREF